MLVQESDVRGLIGPSCFSNLVYIDLVAPGLDFCQTTSSKQPHQQQQQQESGMYQIPL